MCVCVCGCRSCTSRYEHKLRKMLVTVRGAADVNAIEQVVEDAQMAGARRKALDMYRSVCLLCLV